MNNFEMMRKRLEFQGGIHQEDRMIKDKFRTFERALWFSYQGAFAERVQLCAECQLTDQEPMRRVLINPDRIKQDYDDKILSIDAKYGWKPGDVFRWVGTDTYWIIYLEEKTEDAYFRGEIRRCKYKIKFKGEDGQICEVWAAIRGPVETQIDSIQKNQKRIDVPNLSLNILLPNNAETRHMFERYGEFILNGRCWQVQAPDMISMAEPDADCGVLEINAEEYYYNSVDDDLENSIVDGLVIEPVDPTPASGIEGNTFIKPGLQEPYSVSTPNGTWCVTSNRPVKWRKIDEEGTVIEVIWEKMVSGQFDITWSKDDITLTKTVVVESLF